MSGPGVPEGSTAGETSLEAQVDALTAEIVRLRQAVAARENFLAVAAHELRNPMTPILGGVTMLRRLSARGALTPDELARRLDVLERAIGTFVKRATVLLDVSRVMSDHIQVDCVPVNVSEMAAQIAATLQGAAAHAGSTIGVEPASPVTPVVVAADPLALEQVIENLVFNAIKYGEASPITITIAADPARGTASIAVKDRGPGISTAKRAMIFERFERAVSPGSTTTGYGIGLWLVRNLCEAMNGTIAIASEPGRGSTFEVTLPLHPEGKN